MLGMGIQPGIATVFSILWVLVSTTEKWRISGSPEFSIPRLVLVLEILEGVGFEGPGLGSLGSERTRGLPGISQL